MERKKSVGLMNENCFVIYIRKYFVYRHGYEAKNWMQEKLWLIGKIFMCVLKLIAS